MTDKQLSKKAHTALRKGQKEKALTFFKQAATLAEKDEDVRSAIDSLQEASTLAQELGDPELAIELLEKCLLLAEPLHEILLQSSLCNNLALLYLYIGQANQAVDLLTNAIESLIKQAPASVELAQFYNNLGYIERERGNLRSALQYHEQALTLCENQKDTSGIARSRLELGIVNKDLGTHAIVKAVWEPTKASQASITIM